MFVFPPDHPWADGKPIAPEQIAKQQLIGYQRSSSSMRLILEYFRQIGTTPKVLMEVDSIGAIIAMVKFNLGIAVLAPWTLDQELVRGTLRARSLGVQPLQRQWSIISLAAHPKTYIEETFLRLCRNHATGLRLDQNDVRGLRNENVTLTEA